MKDLLSNSSKTTKEIANELGVSTATIVRWRRKHGISPLKSGRKPGTGGRKRLEREIRSCSCGKQFEVIITSTQKSCSRECGYASAAEKISKLKIEHWKNPTQSMIDGIEKRKNPNTSEFKKYSSRVHTLTRKTYELHKDEINPRNLPRTRCGVDGGYQLDHIVSIKEGFETGISAEELSCKDNLRMLPWKKNLMRNWS